MRSFVVVAAKLDANESAIFTNAKTGTYCVYTELTYNGQHLLWNVPIVMKQGGNSMTLDLRNVSPIDR